MPLITITETGRVTDTPNATVSVDHGTPYPITLTSPFSDADDARLRWYFEDHLRFPFTQQVRARQAAESIVTYGEALFMQVFKNTPEIYAAYQAAVRGGLQTLHLDIVGSPTFHQRHWEALREPGRDPFVLHAPMVRRTPTALQTPMAIQPSPTIRLLVVTARPRGRRDVGYRTISRPLIDGLRQAQTPVQVDLVRPGTYRALVEHLRRSQQTHGVGYYHIVHFDLHGAVLTYQALAQVGEVNPHTYQPLLTDRFARPALTPPAADAVDVPKAYLFFEADTDERLDPAEADELARLLREYQIPIAILNACQSGQQVGDTETSLASRLVQAGMQTVLAMGYSVTVSAAALMMPTLYRSLLQHRNLLAAFGEARTALHHEKRRRAYFHQEIRLEDWVLPIVYQPQGEVPATLPLREMTLAEQAALLAGQGDRYQAIEPPYGFVGRDVDILQIEKRVLSTSEGKRRNLLLVQGMGGAGKTTLVHHLGWWWQTTGLVDDVFYFGYDEHAHTRDQLVDHIARRLYNQAVPPGMAVSPEFAQFQAFLPAVRQSLLTTRLRAERHLLILDNLESVTGTSLAVPHTLTAEERALVRGLLADLLDGQTLVLLGSRGREAWLTEGPNAPLRVTDVYELPGLDDEAASTLAERILERHNAGHYRTDEAFLELLKMLDGFPLALEVVLATLVRQTPAEVLAALRAGDVALDQGTGQSRTESLLRCIDYSHRQLPPEAQGLLACLAPFTGVLTTQWLPQYTEHLRQQPALAHLPWERLPAVLQEATDRGLLSPHPDAPELFLRLQPVLPYFLRSRGQAAEHAEVTRAMAVAFRASYAAMSGTLNEWLTSKDAPPRQLGQIMVRLEYENLMTALRLALEDQVSILTLYAVLSHYLDAVKDERRGLARGEMALPRLQAYPEEVRSGPLGAELLTVLDDIAGRQLNLRQYTAAEASYQETLRLLDAQTVLDRDTQGKARASILHHLGMVAQAQRQWARAEQHYQQALAIFGEVNARDAQASTYHQLGRVAQDQRQWAQAEQHYQQALALKIEFNARDAQASTYHQLGRVAQDQRQWAQAEQHYQQALAIQIEFNDRYSQAITYHQLGSVAQDQRQWAQAEQHYQQALALKIEFNNRYSQAITYHNLGMVAQAQRQWAQAEQHYQQALAIFVEFNDRYSQAITYHQLGSVAQEQRQWAQAEQHYQQALAIDVEFNDRDAQASTYHQLGRVAQAQEQWAQAEHYYQQALAIFVEFNDRDAQANTYHNLGMVAEAQEQWPQAREFWLKGLAITVELDDEPGLAITLRSLARLWQATRDTDLPAAIAAVLSVTLGEVETLLSSLLAAEEEP